MAQVLDAEGALRELFILALFSAVHAKSVSFLNQWETEQQAIQSLHLSHSYVHFHLISTKACKKSPSKLSVPAGKF